MTLEGTVGAPGSGGGAGSGEGGSGGGGGASTGAPPSGTARGCLPEFAEYCLDTIEPVTLADIAHFRPDAGIDSMEPDGWMIVGLDTNFYATSGIQVHPGVLLGQLASVRFTPVAWHWSYGDGSTRSSATPGAPWAAQGLREFDATATSHIYRAPGTYLIDLTIDFAPAYRFGGGGWIDIPGVLRVPANRLIAVAGDAKTVLVERDCRVAPVGPGC